MTAKNIVMAAAGVSTGPVLGVEDVFSTYLYTGNGNNNGNDVPNGIQFGGVPTNGTILHFTGDSLSDSAPVPCPFSNVGASVNTTTKKYGTGSLYFNGTSTNIITANSAALRFGTGDFTVECWVYNTSSGNQGIFHLGNDFGSGCVFVNMYPAGFFQWGWDGSYAGSVGSFPSSQWIHVALVRQSGVMKLYVNGTQVGSNNTFAGSINLGRIWVGNYYDTNYAWNGYIDDFRVSNKAVYTANFTPPAQALPIDTLVAGSNYGGMTWMKCRSTAYGGVIFDTLRGGTNTLRPATTDGNRTDGGSIAFNTSGWCVNSTNAGFNAINDTYASWSFRRQPKFFDVVTYTGNGSSLNVSHALASVPGCVMIKRLNSTSDWVVAHRGSGSYWASETLRLNTSAAGVINGEFNQLTDTYVRVVNSGASYGDVNTSGATYVMYLFAHDAGGFGTAGTDNVISCGTFTTDASGNATVNLGYEPQWILTKCTTFAKSWVLGDVMRGAPVTGQSRRLVPNTTAAEDDADVFKPTSTGFTVYETPSQSYIYIAIRRGPMRTPTNGTSVYYGLSRSGTSTNTTASGAPFSVDLAIIKNRFNNDAFASNTFFFDRLRGNLNGLLANATDAQSSYPSSLTGFDVQNGYKLGADSNGWVNWAGSSGGATYMNWMFERAPGFLDIVSYTGTGAIRTVAHGLGAVPELIITKPLSGSGNWATYAAPVGPGSWLRLESTTTPTANATTWNNTAPTSTVFSLGTGNQANFNGYTFIAYLFASLPGVSKVGSYTGTAASLNIDCGFTGGARFVLIKRTNAAGAWYVFDTTRGIVAGNEVYMMLNDIGRDVSADLIAPLSSGFQLTANGSTTVNVNGGTYIFLAIA